MYKVMQHACHQQWFSIRAFGLEVSTTSRYLWNPRQLARGTWMRRWDVHLSFRLRLPLFGALASSFLGPSARSDVWLPLL